VRAAALGLYDREPVPPDILTYLSIGTGISAGTVIGGELLRGSRGVAGELGQIPIAISVSNAGTTLISSEDAAAGPAIGATATEAGIARDRFFSAPAARPVLEVIARVVHTILVAYDPDILYVGGGVARSAEFHAALITTVDDLRARTGCGFVDASRISPIAPGFHPGTAGAIHLAKQAMEKSGRRRRPAEQEETP
jgi:predicted NBD/HSP70 family sugar kinase